MPPKKKMPTRRRFTRKVAPSTKSYVKSMITKARETKSHSYYFNVGQELVSGGTIWKLSAITQGDGAVSERVGDQVDLRRLEFRALLTGQAASASAVAYNARIIIFKWKQDDNVDYPAITDILDHTDYYKSPYVKDAEDRKKFHILYDRNHCLAAPTDAGTPKALSLRMTKNLGAIKFAAADSVGTGHLFLLAMSNYATGTSTPYMTWDSFLTYKD